MKKIFYLFIIIGLGIVSCNKPSDTATLQEVIFKATQTSTNTFKDGQPADCVNPMAQYALIDIDGISYSVDVFYLGGVIYTNSLKLTPGLHTVNTFSLMNDQGTPLDTSDDVIVQATPLLGSEYEKFVEMPLPFEFTVDAFFKLEVDIEILCFVPNDYIKFGFAWYSVEEVIVREVCFFGDICAEDFLDYGQSLYAQQKYGLQHDMPAIFKIEVWRTHNEISDSITTYSNEEWLGEGAPLCVQYPDFKDVEDLTEFKLFILIKVGEAFEYVHLYTFSTMDNMPLENIGEDNIMDFALGYCVQNPDVVIPPYIQEENCIEHFDYSATSEAGPLYWANVCVDEGVINQCGSTVQQSPINIVGAVSDATLSVLETDYTTSTTDILNNGHTIQFNYNGTATLNFDGISYNLLQFHFHTKSEHMVDGYQYPIEVHLVHKSDNGNLAVIGVFFELGEESAFIAQFLNNIPVQGGDTYIDTELNYNVSSLLPANNSYFNYKGSLTTPPCSEIVEWIVMETPLYASQAQIDELAAILHNNYRPIQPLSGRTIGKFDQVY